MFESLAIVGATGAVGGLIRQLLEERNFPIDRVKFLASERSAGKKLAFRGRELTVEALCPAAFDGVDLAIGSTPDETARDFVPWAVERGCTVIDESGFWRMDPKVPLVIPEVNPEAIDRHQGTIASPNCSTTQLVVALKPLHDAARVRRVVVSTYQATSGAGVAGQRDLENGSHMHLHGKEHQYEAFAHPIAFNLIPQIGSPKHEGYTSEEMKMVYETRKIMGDDSIQVCPTCVRVPVSNCHSESILVETERKVTVAEARKLFAAFPGIAVVDDLPNKSYPMPSTCDGRDEVFIGRIREDLSSPNGLAFWCVSDNLRKGAATNAVQIAELLVKRGKKHAPRETAAAAR
ncbi:MAG TPA: aspartate-semialdehyde dehydrogenase [Pirellulales bacterium]|nr:aspartate-semialdehyde dehydrogenase [Pirellulales bacterium]